MQPALKAVQNRIHFVRGERVMLSADLAEIYGVETRALNQAIKLLIAPNAVQARTIKGFGK